MRKRWKKKRGWCPAVVRVGREQQWTGQIYAVLQCKWHRLLYGHLWIQRRSFHQSHEQIQRWGERELGLDTLRRAVPVQW